MKSAPLGGNRVFHHSPKTVHVVRCNLSLRIRAGGQHVVPHLRLIPTDTRHLHGRRRHVFWTIDGNGNIHVRTSIGVATGGSTGL